MKEKKENIKQKKIVEAVLLSLLIVACVASVAMLFTDTRSQWYAELVKPSIQPPGLVFVIAWSVIYLLYAASLALSMLCPAPKKAFVFFAIQGALNILWTLLFFTLHWIALAFVLLLVYLLFSLLTIFALWPKCKIAAALQIPVFFWLLFAAVLNYLIVFLN